jgi:hypothetical protein
MWQHNPVPRILKQLKKSRNWWCAKTPERQCFIEQLGWATWYVHGYSMEQLGWASW